MASEASLISTLVELADSLVDDFDVVELLTLLSERCVQAFGLASAGVLLASPSGGLHLIAASSEAMRDLELFQLQSQEGPCLDCYRTGQPGATPDLSAPDLPWPNFGRRAVAAGLHSVQSLPLRLRSRTIGALNLLRTEIGVMEPSDVVAAQALADVATIATLQHQTILDAQVLNTQLSHALTNRIIIEQAKGMIAEREKLDMNEAFQRLRNHARHNNLRLTNLAQEIVDATVAIGSLRARRER